MSMTLSNQLYDINTKRSYAQNALCALLGELAQRRDELKSAVEEHRKAHPQGEWCSPEEMAEFVDRVRGIRARIEVAEGGIKYWAIECDRLGEAYDKLVEETVGVYDGVVAELSQ